MAAHTASTVTPTAALAIADVRGRRARAGRRGSSLPLHVFRRVGDARERVTSGKLVELLERPAPATSQATAFRELGAANFANSETLFRNLRVLVGVSPDLPFAPAF
jgi:hypothetical protein